MAENKKSVLLYCDLIHTVEKMDNETAGQFFKHYLRYINDQNPETDNLIVDISFESVKQNLKRDLKKWEARAENSRKNGTKGGRPKKTQPEPKKPNGLNENPTEPKEPVKDTVTVTVTDTVKDIVTVKERKKEVKAENKFSTSVLNCFDNCLKHFESHLHPTTEKIKENWLDTIDKLQRIDNIPFEKIEEIVEKTRADDFWNPNFMALPKLRKKNKEQIPYVVVFNERIKPKANEKSNQQIFEETINSNVARNFRFK